MASTIAKSKFYSWLSPLGNLRAYAKQGNKILWRKQGWMNSSKVIKLLSE